MPEVQFAAQPAPAISKFEFLNKFTISELTQIETARETDPELRAFLRLMEMASFIKFDHPRMTSGMQMLVQKSIITETRKNEILQA